MIFRYCLICATMCLYLTSVAQNKNANEKVIFDSTLANKLGADQYGMKHYVMAFLKEGTNKTLDSSESDRLQIAHLKNIIRLADEGKLIVAGPFLDDQPVRGIFIFNVSTVEEARELTATDPAIKAGVLEMELRPWYGSAALIESTHLHKTIQKKSIID
ncbi:MAG: YciI family protein [Ginsengibacter sp.]